MNLNYNDIIAHYTTKEAYYKITRNKSLLASVFSDSNDMSEVCLSKVIASIGFNGNGVDRPNLLLAAVIIKCSYYISFHRNSKSNKFDCNLSKPMAQNFSKKDGYCLMLNKKKLVREIERQYGKDYDIICRNINYKKEILPKYNTGELDAMEQCNSRELAIKLMLEKDKQFSYERETRIVIVPKSPRSDFGVAFKNDRIHICLQYVPIISCRYYNIGDRKRKHKRKHKRKKPDRDSGTVFYFDDSIASPFEAAINSNITKLGVFRGYNITGYYLDILM
jgi:hypothetical protein